MLANRFERDSQIPADGDWSHLQTSLTHPEQGSDRFFHRVADMAIRERKMDDFGTIEPKLPCIRARFDFQYGALDLVDDLNHSFLSSDLPLAHNLAVDLHDKTVCQPHPPAFVVTEPDRAIEADNHAFGNLEHASAIFDYQPHVFPALAGGERLDNQQQQQYR